MWQSVCRKVNETGKEQLLAQVKALYPLAAFQARAVRMDFNEEHVASGEHGGEFAPKGQGGGGIVTMPRVAHVAHPVTRTPEFRAWFGKSKIVTEAGEPLVVYHGTGSDFTKFKISKMGGLGPGIYVTTDPKIASVYAHGDLTMVGSRVIPLFARAENPFIIEKNNGLGMLEPSVREMYEKTKGNPRRPEIFKKAGYDGIWDKRFGEIVVFSSTQIKSALGNKTFNPKSKDIMDSYSSQVDLMFDAALKSTFSIWTEDRLADLARRQAIQVSDLNRRQLTEALVKALGVGGVLWADPWLKSSVDAFVSENVALITSIPEQAYTRSRSMVMRALERGDRVEDLAGELEDTFDVSRARANLIGRDQTCKFYGQVNELRQKEAGVERYTWRTVQDERVRPAHAELEGTEQRWDDPPVTNPEGDTNNPGGDYQCRCTAEPIFEEAELNEF